MVDLVKKFAKASRLIYPKFKGTFHDLDNSCLARKFRLSLDSKKI